MQKITLILGGTRSGKSAHGEMLALKNFSSPIYIFTAQAWDDEMKSRIKTHKKRREGKNWKDIEAPIAIFIFPFLNKRVGIMLLIGRLPLTTAFGLSGHGLNNAIELFISIPVSGLTTPE